MCDIALLSVPFLVAMSVYFAGHRELSLDGVGSPEREYVAADLRD